MNITQESEAMWQICPICNGTGKIHQPLSTATYATCDVCNGKKIIHSVTGLPPNVIL